MEHTNIRTNEDPIHDQLMTMAELSNRAIALNRWEQLQVYFDEVEELALRTNPQTLALIGNIYLFDLHIDFYPEKRGTILPMLPSSLKSIFNHLSFNDHP